MLVAEKRAAMCRISKKASTKVVKEVCRADWKLTSSSLVFQSPDVSLFRRIAVIVLMALWFGASQHCALEAAELLDDTHNDLLCSACCNEAGGLHDGCNVSERETLASTGSAVKVTAPDLLVCGCHVCQLLLVELRELSEASVTPFEKGAEASSAWLPVWHFVRKAAPSPRAPSLALV